MRWENIIFISLNLLFSSRVETEDPGDLGRQTEPRYLILRPVSVQNSDPSEQSFLFTVQIDSITTIFAPPDVVSVRPGLIWRSVLFS